MHQICVIDNSTLVNLTRLQNLKIFFHLRLLFNAIHVPVKILAEYEEGISAEPARVDVISKIQNPDYQFLVYCTSFDSIAHVILQTTPGIDPGEAEAAAQHKSLNSRYVLSDDLKFIKAIQIADKHVRILTTLHLIALLDFNGIISNPEDFLKELYKHSPFSSLQLRSAYLDVAKDLGLNPRKSEVSKKSSLKALGLK
jgi:predicted nucleic acid-binding protein